MTTFGIAINGGWLTLRNMERGSLPRVLDWYNSGDMYRYATGVEGKVTLGELEEKLALINGGDREFFLGIYRCRDGELVGAITGSLVRRTLWIKLLAVATEYRRRGCGTAALELLLDHFRRMGLASGCCISVIEQNGAGRDFWRKNGFKDVKRLQKRHVFDGAENDIIIMHKAI